jgi:hypothetical protein
MALIEKTTEIEAPIELVYEISQDYSVRYEWDPFPEKISIIAGPAELAIGTQVLVRSKLGMEMVVEFVQLVPPTRAAIKMIRGPYFISKFAGSWIFEPLSETTTLARFRYSLSMRPRWLAWPLQWAATAYFSGTARKRLAGLKRYCEARVKAAVPTPPAA